MKINNKNILIISPDAWGSYFLSKHHYALELSKNNTVYFLNHSNRKGKFEIEKLQTNLYSVDYQSVIPKINLLPKFLQNIIFRNQIKNLKKKIKVDFDIVWSFDAFRFNNLKHFKAKINIFHLVDQYKNGLETQIAASADIVFTSSKSILTLLKNTVKPKYEIKHGVAAAFFNTTSKNIKLPGNNKIKALYSGNLNHKHINFLCFKQLILENEKIDFVMLGRSDENHAFTKFLKLQKNVFFIDSKPYFELINYYKKANILLICYDEKIKESPPLPHKLYEYLASGNVVLCNNLKHLAIENNLLLKAENENDYLQQFKYIIENLKHLNNSNLAQNRIALAKTNSYANQLLIIEEKLSKHKLI